MDEGEHAVLIDGRQGGFQCGRHVHILGDRDPEAAEGPGHQAEVRVLQLGSGDACRVVPFLVGADGAVFLVVHDDDQRRGPVLGGGGELLAVHEEFAVPGDGDHTAPGVWPAMPQWPTAPSSPWSRYGR